MEKLMEHTLQRQLIEQKQMTAQLQGQVTELASLLKGQLLVSAGQADKTVQSSAATGGTLVAVQQGGVATVITAPITTNVQNNITIIPWDGDRKISFGAGQVAAAFAENERLKEYSKLEGDQLTNPAIAPPYVTELLTDLTRRAHADPAARNIYLNPKRADQVLVYMQSGKWDVCSLIDATRLLFDGVAKNIHQIEKSYEERKKLPLEAQNALSIAGLMYEDERDEYVKRAKAPMSAHLQNTRPAQLC